MVDAEPWLYRLSHPPGRPRIIRTKTMIQKVKNRLQRCLLVTSLNFPTHVEYSEKILDI